MSERDALIPRNNNWEKQIITKEECLFCRVIFYVLCLFTGQFFVGSGNILRGDNHAEQTKKTCQNCLCVCCICCSSIVSFAFAIIFSIVNLSSCAVNVFVIIRRPFSDCDYFYSVRAIGDSDENLMKYFNWNKMVIIFAAASAFTSYLTIVYMVLLPLYTSCRKCVTCSKISCCNRLCDIFCNKLHRSCKSKVLLSPFRDDESEYSTALGCVQSCYFYLFYFLNLILYALNLAIILVIWYIRTSNKVAVICFLDILGMLCQMASQFCAIQSCFIFSKIAYASSNQCSDILKTFVRIDNWSNEEITRNFLRCAKSALDISILELETSNPSYQNVDVNRPGIIVRETESQEQRQQREKDEEITQFFETLFDVNNKRQCDMEANITDLGDSGQTIEEDMRKIRGKCACNDINQARLYLLQTVDQQALKNIRSSIEPYGIWFSVHWTFYMLTAFVSVAFLADTIVLFFYDITRWYSYFANDTTLAYLVLFTLEHTFLFLYPCFRAVQVTTAREKLITRVSKYKWENINMLTKITLIDYMRSQNFGFRISIFCADVTFGFNLAFLSIFIGIFGVILKLSF